MCRLYHNACFIICLSLAIALADAAESSRRAPVQAVAVPPEIRTELEKGVSAFGTQIDELGTALKGKPTLRVLMPDVEIFHKAVQWPLLYSEFYRSNEFAIARTLLKQGMERAQALREGRAPWLTATGLVVRGYVSRIDGSVQPYGLVVPASFQNPNRPLTPTLSPGGGDGANGLSRYRAFRLLSSTRAVSSDLYH